MGQILVRNINDQALETLKARALRKGSSLEAEVRRLIENDGKPSTEEILEEMRRIRAMTSGPLRSLSADEYREGLE
ncbi:MAG: hypothetical protein IPL47_04945 [Phyllobacteriaceae bacterium]|nr:hypothetical protein [Phyllobacteriaceae bacterium]